VCCSPLARAWVARLATGWKSNK